MIIIETGIVPLMLLQKDRRAFHRNMFTRAKMLTPEQRAEYERLINDLSSAVTAGDSDALRSVQKEVLATLCRLARPAFERYGLTFPTRVEAEMVALYDREWPE